MTGIYRIKNKINGKCYIGSSVNFDDRKNLHFSLLRRGIHHSIILQRAYDKYGLEFLSFEVLEHCEKEILIEREQWYIDNLDPEYNACKIAGSTLGIKSVRRKAVFQYDLLGNFIKEWECLQDIMKEFNLSNSSKISEVCKRKRKKIYGYVWRYVEDPDFSYVDSRAGKRIAEVDVDGNILRIWDRQVDCATELNVSPSTISRIIKNGKYKNKYFKRV